MSDSNATAFRTVAFGDVDGRLWGAAVELRPGQSTGIVLGGADHAALAGEPTWTVQDRAWQLAGDGFELSIEPRGETPADEDAGSEPEVSGLQELCRVHGRLTAGGVQQAVDCLGTRSEIDGIDPGVIGSARAISGWFGPDEAIAVVALRPRQATDQEGDLIAGTLFDPDGWVPVTDPRLSTTYTRTGDPARASLELWVADGENEFPRRAAGEAAGAAEALNADDLELRVAPLRCHSRGLEGAGVYVLATL